MSLSLNLEKSAKALVLSLEKAGIITPPALEVGFGLDVSKSFEDEHRAGITDRLLTRLVPWGLAFDPDRKLDVFTFSDGANNVQDVGPVDEHNFMGFVPSRVVGKVIGWNGGTDYSYLVEKVLAHFGWMGEVIVKKAGFLGRLFGQKDIVSGGEKKRSLLIVATDGDNYDKERTRKVLRESEARGDKVYILFIGISNQGESFSFLEQIRRDFSNVGFVKITDLRKFLDLNDDELNAELLDDKLLKWFADGQ